jgi:predicted transposase/invertase (TIGR01784 family)
MSENDWENALEFAEKKGRKAGMEAGKKTIAKNLLADGFPVDQVAKWTGLSESEIAELAR